MSPFQLSYKPFGESAVLVEWPSQMKEEILKDILLFHQKINQKNINEIIETIQSINSLTVIYDNNLISFHYIKKVLQEIYFDALLEVKREHYLWKIPVCYDLDFGLDLKVISNKNNLPIKQIIELHTEAIYQVYSIGFLPGFLYLGGLDERLHIDRKNEPRLKVPKGAVSIGGSQTGIYPKVSPGGWQIIGNTPITFFDQTKEVPCFAKPGDKIQFVQISYNEYEQFQREISLNEFTLKKEVIDD